jgi:hypothetical protein
MFSSHHLTEREREKQGHKSEVLKTPAQQISCHVCNYVTQKPHNDFKCRDGRILRPAYYLFPFLKQSLGGSRLTNDGEVERAVTRLLITKDTD